MSVILLVVNFLTDTDYDSIGNRILKSVVQSFFFILLHLLLYYISKLLHLDPDGNSSDAIIGGIIYFVLLSIYHNIFVKKDSY